MTACAACGASAASAARFCRLCGAPLGLDEHDGVAQAPVSSASTTVRREAPTRWWLAVVAAVALVGMSAVWIRDRADGGQPESSSEEPAAGTLDRSSTPTTDTTPVTDEGATDPGTIMIGPAVTVSPHDELTGTGEAGPDGTSGVYVAEKGGGPVLGHPIGWSVLLGDPYNPDQGLWRLDLDTGRLVQYPGVSGGPLLVAGDRLVLLDDGTEFGGDQDVGSMQVVSVDDPVGPGIPIDASATYFPPSTFAAEPGAGGDVWVFQDGDEPRWQLIRIDDGAVVDEVALADTSLVPGGLVPGGGLEVVTSASGDVYRRDGDGFHLLVAGRPVVVSGGQVLVRTCSSPTTCELRWVDRDSGQLVDRATPPSDDPNLWWQQLVPGSDRFLAGVRVTTGEVPYEVILYDLVAGRFVDQVPVSFNGGVTTPDGGYLLVDDLDQQQLSLYDVGTGDWHTLSRPAELSNVVAVFVPNS